MTARFYILGKKGLHTLKAFVSDLGPAAIDRVFIGHDSGIADDHRDPIEAYCRQHKIPVAHGNKASDQALPAALAFAIGWRRVIMDEPKLVILHDSLLPQNRGFAPLVGSLIAGETTIGVTALLAAADYDTGPILSQEQTSISYPIKIAEAMARLEPLYASLTLSVYRTFLEQGVLDGIAQEAAAASYSLWLDDRDYYIDWTWPAEKIARFVDAVGEPYGGAKARVNNETLILDNAEAVPDVDIRDRARHIGKVIFKAETSITVVCGSGLLQISHISDASGEPLTVPFRTRFH